MDTVTGVGVIDKSVLIIAAVAVEPLGLPALQSATGLPRATAHRLAMALEAHGVLARDSDGRFDLGPQLAVWGRAAERRYPLAEAALGILTWVRDHTTEGVQLFVREADQRRCIVSLPASHALRWIVPDGALFPLAVGSAGRALSGEAMPGEWVESVEEREPGVASVSAPVVGPGGGVVAAVCVSGPIERISRTPGARFGAIVVEASRRLGAIVQGSEELTGSVTDRDSNLIADGDNTGEGR